MKRREKPLSPEEIKERVLKAYSDSWQHSEPHFGFLPDGSLFPLSKTFQDEIVILFILDAGDYCTERVYEFLQHLRVTYPRLPWTPIISFGYRYDFLKNSKFFDRFKAYPTFHSTPLFLDINLQLDKLHRPKTESAPLPLPVAVFFRGGFDISKVPLGKGLDVALAEVESVLQNALRMNDRGLPMPFVRPLPLTLPVDSTRFTLQDVVPQGTWFPAEHGIVTDDPKATITVNLDGKTLRLISALHPQARDACKIHVTLNDKAVPQNLCGSNLKLDDKGHSTVEINRSNGTYELISSSSALKGIVKLHFVSVIENPVVFYELRSAS